jgi:LCP family protein required for cell wall assembly
VSASASEEPADEPAQQGDTRAKNFLIVGSDSRDCIDPKSPYAGAFLTKGGTGHNSDTIMLIRVDPNAKTAALLSFPRDMWVKLAGTNASGKINSVYSVGNPSRLVQTIEENFKLTIDHYIDVDFCAFRDIVEAVGGVSVPFEYWATDANTGLDVKPGCHRFLGDEAIAYVRSRSYNYFDDSRKKWISDPDSDYGRIARQQDFIRRTLQRAIDQGARKPAVTKRLIDTALSRVKVDLDLRVNDLLLLSGKLKDFDPARLRTYRFDGAFANRAGQSVIIPAMDYAPNKAVLAVFRGEARLNDAPDPATLPSTSSSSSTSTTTSTTTTVKGQATSSTEAAPTTTAVVEFIDNRRGFSPPVDPSCR